MKDILTHIAIVILVILFASLISACASTSVFEQKFENLLYKEENRNVAYKSITIKDFQEEDFCG